MSKQHRFLSIQGVQGPSNRLFDKQRAELDIRANFTRRVQQNPDTYIDPVLRFHLGLDAVNPPPPSLRLRLAGTFTNLPNHPNFFAPTVNVSQPQSFGKLTQPPRKRRQPHWPNRYKD